MRKAEDSLKPPWNQKVYWCLQRVLKGTLAKNVMNIFDVNCTPEKFIYAKYRMCVNFFLGRLTFDCCVYLCAWFVSDFSFLFTYGCSLWWIGLNERLFVVLTAVEFFSVACTLCSSDCWIMILLILCKVML